MNLLLELSWRGALMLVVVASLDRLLATKINARTRRAWWLLVPLAFLVTVPLPMLPAAKPSAAQFVGSPGAVALSVDVTTHPAGQVADAVPVRWPRTSWVLVVALSGSAFYLLIALARTCAALRRFRGLPLCTDPALLRLLKECQAEGGVTTPRVGLVVSERVPTPLVMGWLRPRILLPSALVAHLSREQLRGVLFHELAHVRARDVPCTFLFTLVCALHWFNPAAHLALRWWAQFREEAADEVAIASLGASSNLAYGETLLCVLRAVDGSRQTSPVALAIVGSVGQLRKRLLMIKQHPSKSSHRILAPTVFVAAATVLLHPVRATVPDDASAAALSSNETNTATAKPPTDLKVSAIQVAGVTVAILPGGASRKMTFVGDINTTLLRKEKTTEWKGDVMMIEARGQEKVTVIEARGGAKVQITVPGHSPVIITGNDLTFVGQDSASPEVVKVLGNSSPSTSTGKFDASGNPVLPPPASWELQCGGIPVLVMPVGATKGDMMEIITDGGAAFNPKTRVSDYSGKVTLTLNVPSQSPIVVTGEDLTLVPRW